MSAANVCVMNVRTFTSKRYGAMPLTTIVDVLTRRRRSDGRVVHEGRARGAVVGAIGLVACRARSARVHVRKADVASE
jgi:hypothetical protein